MAKLPDARDRQQPSLLDRLIEREPQDKSASEAGRMMSRTKMREAVRRDIEWLFNAIQPHAQWDQLHPTLAGTVLNFGMPPLAGQRASQLDLNQLKKSIDLAIRRFEPRIVPDSLQVRVIESNSVLDTHNMIEFEIQGELTVQPVGQRILFRTQLDLEAGQVRVDDALSPPPPRVPG